MPFCPNCNYEYIEGGTICPDCGEALVEEIEKPEEWDEENWEVVFTSSKEYEVEMLKNNLDGAGITSTILSQKDRNFPAVGDFAIIKLMVRKEDVSPALEFIEKIQSEDQPGHDDQQEEDVS
jgi:hypothetical protein